ncbi:MAG: molybdopterin dehydrogenase [Acidobacteria bacterium]|nr:MAG: molybdopterin dehydrogenase [Acidobacteriota bacterium]
MERFEYAHPTTQHEAIGLLGSSWNDAAVLAGGTDLISLMKEYVVTPKRVVNIKNVEGLDGIHSNAEGVTIGALVTMDELLADKTIRSEFPALVHAAEGITSPQIRAMGTVGGDLCQRPRCWYFRNGYGLLAMDESGHSLVRDGENRYHAILGNSGPAYFVNPSSLAPALIALDAKLQLEGRKGKREVRASEFFIIPKSDSERENVLEPHEVLTHIVIPASSRGFRSATYEVRHKTALDWPLAAAAVAVKLEGGKVREGRIVLGHVAPIPWPAPDAEKELEGKSITESTAASVGEAAVRGAKPLSQNGYKIQLTKVAVKRALLAAAKGEA